MVRMEVVGDTAAVGVVALYIAHEGVHQVCCQLVYPVVVISIFREVAFHNIISYNALIVAHRLDPGIFDGGQESATTERPAMPVANQRVTFLSWSAICSLS